jgi:hypothetical protein
MTRITDVPPPDAAGALEQTWMAWAITLSTATA